jgi:hypothetical protein
VAVRWGLRAVDETSALPVPPSPVFRFQLANWIRINAFASADETSALPGGHRPQFSAFRFPLSTFSFQLSAFLLSLGALTPVAAPNVSPNVFLAWNWLRISGFVSVV